MDHVQGEKVSIIIPVYNVENYLVECLESAINQTHKNKEIIIIDDGSTDNSSEIIEIFRKNFSEIVVIRTENRGQSAARNTGLNTASGEYILFLDSDDWLEADTLELCVKYFREQAVDIVLFNAEAFADGLPESEVRKFNYIRPSQLVYKRESCEKIFSISVENKKYIVSPCLYMFKRRSFLCERFLDGIVHEDNLFTTQLLINNPAASAFCLPNLFFHRRLRPESTMTQKKSLKHVNGYFSVAEELSKISLNLRSLSLSASLSKFIQEMIINAIMTAILAFKGKVPFGLRKKALRILLKVDMKYIKIKYLIFCVSPEVIHLKKLFKNK